MLAFGLGGYEWLVVLAVALLLFGHRIPGMARSLGAGVVEFKKGLKSGDKDELPPGPTPGDKTPKEGQANP
jgi:sec-independent protein translocase protein TatA